MTRLVPSLRDPHIFLPAYREVLQSLRNGLHLQSTQSHQAYQATDAECKFLYKSDFFPSMVKMRYQKLNATNSVRDLPIKTFFRMTTRSSA